MKTILALFKKQFQYWRLNRRWNKAKRQAAKIIQRTKSQYPNGDAIFAVSPIWPAVSGRDPGLTIKGVTTIMWGTPGILVSPKPASGYYAVLRVNQRPILDRSKLPTGAGQTSTDVILQDGVTMEMTVRDDSQMTPPVINTACTVVDISGLIGLSGSTPLAGVTYSARVVDNNYETAVKQAGERVLVLDNLVLIDSQTTSSQATN